MISQEEIERVNISKLTLRPKTMLQKGGKPNIQKLGDITFDSNTARPMNGFLVVKDIKTGKDFSVIRNDDGTYDWHDGTIISKPLTVVSSNDYIKQNALRFIKPNLDAYKDRGVNYNIYKAWSENGKPKIVPRDRTLSDIDYKQRHKVDKYGFIAHYLGADNSVHIPKFAVEHLGLPGILDETDMMSELAHSAQKMNGQLEATPKSLYNDLKAIPFNIARSAGEDTELFRQTRKVAYNPYQDPENIEYQAHSVIEPKLLKQYSSEEAQDEGIRTTISVPDRKRVKLQSGGYYNNPYSVGKRLLEQLPAVTNTIYETYQNDQLSEQEKNRELGFQGAKLGLGLFNTIGDSIYSNRVLASQRQVPSYTPAPYQRYGYNSALEDMYHYQTGGTYQDQVDQMGYKDESPFRFNDYLNIRSNRITMQGVSNPLIGVSDKGQVQLMAPGKEYHYPGATQVREYKMETGGEVDDSYGQYDYTPLSGLNSDSDKDLESYWSEDLPFTVSDEGKDMINSIQQNKNTYKQSIVNVQEQPIQNNMAAPTIFPVVDSLKRMGINPSSVNSGHHNVGSKHYLNKAVDLGLNTSFGGDSKKMRQFKSWFESEGTKYFPNVRLVDETERPKGQKVWSGAHYHLELQ